MKLSFIILTILISFKSYAEVEVCQSSIVYSKLNSKTADTLLTIKSPCIFAKGYCGYLLDEIRVEAFEKNPSDVNCLIEKVSTNNEEIKKEMKVDYSSLYPSRKENDEYERQQEKEEMAKRRAIRKLIAK